MMLIVCFWVACNSVLAASPVGRAKGPQPLDNYTSRDCSFHGCEDVDAAVVLQKDLRATATMTAPWDASDPHKSGFRRWRYRRIQRIRRRFQRYGQRDMFLKDATHGNGSYEAKSFRIQNLGHGGPRARCRFVRAQRLSRILWSWGHRLGHKTEVATLLTPPSTSQKVFPASSPVVSSWTWENDSVPLPHHGAAIAL
ncbi:unnamed protein product [Cladocopium goreaui]|uniref:Secreted protein n=1 Tax=Cladocopium goreaui TaxID=2562237 RepID=A0A9P1C164_9DINO|nr:unnamed protein product [Cladocopium goreaui]